MRNISINFLFLLVLFTQEITQHSQIYNYLLLQFLYYNNINLIMTIMRLVGHIIMSNYIYPYRKNIKNSSSSSTCDIKGLSRICSAANQIKISKFRQRGRLASKSNQQLQWEVQSPNPEKHQNITQSIQQKQLFQSSFQKIKKIKDSISRHHQSSLNQELNDIMDLLRGERVRAKLLIQQLQSEGEKVNDKSESIGVNTIDMIEEIQESVAKQVKECEAQTCIFESENDGKYRSYEKLVNLLHGAKMNYHSILPQWKQYTPSLDQIQYKQLGTADILKLQQCFMKKLATQIKESYAKKLFRQQQHVQG